MEPLHTAVLDVGAAFAPLDRCPSCASDRWQCDLQGDPDGADHPTFICTACGVRWWIELGRILHIDHDAEHDG